MLEATRKLLRRLRGDRSGNAMMMVAIGAPALIGASGLGVDVAQWYLWQRELQYAVDQAAIAGGYARGDLRSMLQYESRAEQEFQANLQLTEAIASEPDISLSNYDGGVLNMITVTATASDRLPFSSLFTRADTTVAASASATFERDEGWTACLLALNPEARKAIWFNGGPDVTAGCGVASLSRNDRSVEVSGGAGELELGWIVSAGGVDDYFDDDEHTTIREHVGELYDPFEDVSVPEGSDVERTVDCGLGDALPTYTALFSITETTIEKRYEGRNAGQMLLASVSAPSVESWNATAAAVEGLAIGDSQTVVTTDTVDSGESGHGNDRIAWRVDAEVTTTRTVTAITEDAAVGAGNGMLQPGTYTDFDINNKSCVMAPGIYVIDGGSIKLSAAGSALVGTGVLFVLKNGATIDITGGTLDLTGMGEDELIDAGMSASDAHQMQNVLFFEDKDEQSSVTHTMTGNATSFYNGIAYLPRSTAKMLGSLTVSSTCLMVAADMIEIGGTANFETFCPAGLDHTVNVSRPETIVRLVS